eukprot:TRINITY_DN3154_c0_g1_i1.p1 TRINITY_DN3154_c0_g1~~TRINITY_DN3154_c0_g1_i1.p1  ORF type:complete len:480 (+),score=174.97 TRINITY_DN3154_c0_g1_i1:49-1488(+)
MKVTVATLSDTVFTLDVSEDLEIENFKAFCEVESGIPSAEIGLLFNGIPMIDLKKSLKDYGVAEGDMVMMDRMRRQAPRQAAAPRQAGAASSWDFSQIQVPTNLLGGGGAAAAAGSSQQSQPARNEEDPAWIREMLQANPDQLAMLKQNNPRLAEAYESGNLEEFGKVLKEQQNARKDREAQRIRMMNADPFDLEAQRLIATEIEQKNIDQNMELAMEASPESFGSVIMLYINCTVNGHQVKAFVDSGAQATIMSQKAAERCNIMRLVDPRWAGIAKGVGTQKIIGRVHMAQIQIEKDFLTSSFSILEDQPMDMLLGLDMLKKHQCTIDLRKNCLVIGTTGTETPFLPESELPPCARLSSQVNEEDVIKASAKETAALEDKQLAEAIARSASDSSMDTSESNSEKAGTSGTSSTPVAAAPSSDILPTDTFKEADVANMIAMGFPRASCITELRKNGGDVNLAVAGMFAKSLSESFNKKK